MRTTYFLVIAMFFSINCISQEIAVRSFETIDQSIYNSSVVKYPDDYKIQKIKSFDEAKNIDPENALASYYSANNKEWFEFNLRLKNSLSYHDFNQLMVEDFTIYPKLKLSFTANGINHSIIKFEIRNEKNGVFSHAIHFEKNGSLWYVSNANICANLYLFFILIDIKYLYPTLVGSISDNENYNLLLERNKVDGRLNFHSFLVDLIDIQNRDLMEFQKFSDPNSNY